MWSLQVFAQHVSLFHEGFLNLIAGLFDAPMSLRKITHYSSNKCSNDGHCIGYVTFRDAYALDTALLLSVCLLKIYPIIQSLTIIPSQAKKKLSQNFTKCLVSFLEPLSFYITSEPLHVDFYRELKLLIHMCASVLGILMQISLTLCMALSGRMRRRASLWYDIYTKI